MDTLVFDEERDGMYRIAILDRRAVFDAANPGAQAVPREYPLDPSLEQRAQVFYALAPMVKADDLYLDLRETLWGPRLNTWMIGRINQEENAFASLRVPDMQDRIRAYAVRHSVTAPEPLRMEGSSLHALFDVSSHQKWKNGVLQRCIDCIVKPEFRTKAIVYASLDVVYRYVLRWCMESESSVADPLMMAIRQLCSMCGWSDTLDETVVTIPETAWPLVDVMVEMIPRIQRSDTPLDNLRAIIFAWSGGRLIEVDGGYCIQVDADVRRAVQFMDAPLCRPDRLEILESIV